MQFKPDGSYVQGVRMEVGKHAWVMNRVLMSNTIRRNIDHSTGRSVAASPCSAEQTVNEEVVDGSYNSMQALATTLMRQDDPAEEETRAEAAGSSRVMIAPLKETVGHTKVEVTAGALLGFFIGLVVHALDVM